MATIIVKSELPSAIQSADMIDAMIDGANAKASRVAPCLAGTGDAAPSSEQLAEARLVLIGAVRRWVDAGSGALQSRQDVAGPYSHNETIDTRQRTGYNLWPSEIADLQAICSAGSVGREVFSIDTAPAGTTSHAETCSLYFGATYCSCGADIAGYPLFGV